MFSRVHNTAINNLQRGFYAVLDTFYYALSFAINIVLPRSFIVLLSVSAFQANTYLILDT